VYNEEEYAYLRRTAQQLHFSPEVTGDLDKNYSFVHDMTRKVMTGAINSITGMCYDVAILNYAGDARPIERWSKVAHQWAASQELDEKRPLAVD
jgi:hypothetical protein